MEKKRRDSKGRILRNGEVQRADGLYMFRYIDEDGKRKTVYSWKLVATDKAPDGKRCTVPLRDIEKDILRDIEDGIHTGDANRITVNDLFESFMQIRRDLRESTRCNYQCVYDSYVRETLGWRQIKGVKHTDIQKLYMDMAQELQLSISTIEKIHSILYQMFSNAVMDNLLRTNPASNALSALRKIVHSEPKERHALTVAEQEHLIDYVYHTKQYMKWSTLFTVLLGTGMRIGEALGLRWDDCDFEKNTISVNHILLYKAREHGGYGYRISSPKTLSGIRTIPMFQDVKKALLIEKERKRSPDIEIFEVDGYKNFIFLNSNGKVYTQSAFFDAIQRITTDYNMEETLNAEKEHREPHYLPKMSAHILRHSFCTRLCENESDIKVVQDVMGHKSSRTTMDIYNEATAERKTASFERLEGKIKLS